MRRTRHNTEQNRYELTVGDDLAGIAEYHRTEAGLVVFTHTEVEPRFEGQGVGGELVRYALDDLRLNGWKALPVCPFVQAWIAKHPDYHDLDYRAQGSS